MVLIDIAGDGSWDYSFDGALALYRPFPWLFLIIGIAITILAIIVILFKTGILFVYEEEQEMEE